LIISDVLTLRDSACRKLDVIVAGHMPGGKEHELVTINDEEDNVNDGIDRSSVRRASVQHQFVTSMSRCYSAVRLEIVQSAKNFLAERLNIEADGTVQLMAAVINAQTCTDFVTASVAALKLFTSTEEFSVRQQELVHECCDCWPKIAEIQTLDDKSDTGMRLSYRLRQMYTAATGILQFLLGAFLVVSPHSMGTKRVVSHHNKLKSIQRASLANDTINDRLVISINGTGTAAYDPRPAVAAFLQKKQRRFREPESDMYQQRDFIRKFFRVDTVV